MIADALRVVLILVLAAISLLLAYQLPGDVFLDFGPNDGRYVRGFREDFEVDEPTLIHWSGDRSSVSLPFVLNGPFDVTLRYKRHIATPADVRFFFGDEPAGTVTVPQQDFGLYDLHADNASGGPFRMRISSSSRDPRPLGVALDWMQVRPSSRFGAVVPSTASLLYVLSWVFAFYLVPRLLGLGHRVASGSAIAAAACLTALAGVHKLWPVHAAMTLGARTHAMALLLVAFYLLRRRAPRSAFATTQARWAVYLVYAGLAVRLFALFHPDFYYPDVRTHSKFVSLIWTEGLDGFFSDYIDNQHTHLLGLQLVGGEWLAFPYPPLLYLSIYPLSLLQLPVEDWMKIVPTALLAVEALVLFALANQLGIGTKAGLAAVALHATARVLGFRLAVASYAALFGHFWDVLVVLYLVVFFDRIERLRYAAGLLALVAVSILSYAGSALVLGLFVPIFCVALVVAGRGAPSEAKRAVWIAACALLGAIVAVGAFYWQYVPEIVSRPETAASSTELIDASLTPLSALSMTAYRLHLFYSVFGFAALASLYFLRGTLGHRLAAPLAAAAIGTFVGLNFLRAGLGSTHIFQFSKDDLVILPVVVLALGMVTERMGRGRASSAIAAAVVLAWMSWGLVAFAEDVRARFIRPDYPPPAPVGRPLKPRG